ncbi:MAG: S41 family peptidase [Desulfitobacteriaceae bacterium]
MNKRTISKIALRLVLSLTLLVAVEATSVLAAVDETSQVSKLLNNYYVDSVSDQVLNAPTIDGMLKNLGDPYTRYFTAQEYQDFINALDQRFTGIGIQLKIIPEGVSVVSVIKGSPAAEAGMQTGDVIITVDGQALAARPQAEAVALLRGDSGTQVRLKIKRGGQIKDLTLTRRKLEEPTVNGKVLEGHMGYVQLNTFGEDTPADFAKVVDNLIDQQVDCWIFDLRDNPGGYLSTAQNLAGYFIGENTTLQMKDRSHPVKYLAAVNQGWTFTQPVVFLINENSASAAEILAAAVKDNHKATLIGKTTFGKGVAQSMFVLSSGGRLKMTTNRFYSPEGHEIQKVGVTPDILTNKADPLSAAELLLENNAIGTFEGTSIGVNTGGYNYKVTVAQVIDSKYWGIWNEVLASVHQSALRLDRPQGWSTVSEADLQKRWPLYFPSYDEIGGLANVPLNKTFKVHFSGPIDWSTINNSSVELINSTTGERSPVYFQAISAMDLKVIPQNKLQPETTYWLVIHPTIRDVNQRPIIKGTVTMARTPS